MAMKYDTKKVGEATLALLYLVSWKEALGVWAWKSFEINRLHEKEWMDFRSEEKS